MLKYDRITIFLEFVIYCSSKSYKTSFKRCPFTF